MKRALDVALAGIGMVVLAPLFLVLAAAIRVGLGAPVLFRQERPGLGGRTFMLYKFRTMRESVDEEGGPLPDEDRLTRLGRLLRSSSLDELPELWNVLKGDMSLVGPRPLLPEYLPLYDEEQARRHEVRPGITGLAQVSGRNRLDWEERLAIDVWYVDNRSLRLDLWILVSTPWTVVRGEGIRPEGRTTMEPFRG